MSGTICKKVIFFVVVVFFSYFPKNICTGCLLESTPAQ